MSRKTPQPLHGDGLLPQSMESGRGDQKHLEKKCLAKVIHGWHWIMVAWTHHQSLGWMGKHNTLIWGGFFTAGGHSLRPTS